MKKIINFLLFISLTSYVSAQTKSKIDSAVNTAIPIYMNDPIATGISIGIYKDGKQYTYNYGEVHKGKNDRPSKNTIYAIGSISKTMTGALLAKAVLENKVKLDDDIRKYLVGDYPNLEYRGRPITMSLLLNHHSGLPYMLPPDSVYSKGSNELQSIRLNEIFRHYTKADFFKDLHQVKIDTFPGTTFHYSNTGAILAGYIMEKLYGISFEQLLKQQVTSKLKMTDTKILFNAAQNKRIANGYDDKGKLMPRNPDGLQGAGGINSTVDDMLKYISWQLNENDTAVKLSHDPTWQTGDYWAGLNWQVLRGGNGQRIIWQSGNVAGFTSYCVLYPESKMGIVILTNEESRSSAGLIENMVNHIATSIIPTVVTLPK